MRKVLNQLLKIFQQMLGRWNRGWLRWCVFYTLCFIASCVPEVLGAVLQLPNIHLLNTRFDVLGASQGSFRARKSASFDMSLLYALFFGTNLRPASNTPI